MRVVKTSLLILLLFVLIAGGCWLFVRYYSYLFSERVTGVVLRVDVRDTKNSGTSDVNESLAQGGFGCAVAVKTKSGDIFTSACEDQEWSVIAQGDCVEAVFYPYPPWNLEKSGTYLNARLKKQFECETPTAAEQL